MITKDYLSEMKYENQEIIRILFSQKKNTIMFIDLLRFERKDVFFDKTVIILGFFCNLADNIQKNELLEDFLNNHNLLKVLKDA